MDAEVIVVGAGMGGLATALTLASKGVNVKLLEANDQPGGRASAIRDQGFVFDKGPTIITAPFLLEDLFSASGKSIHRYLDLHHVDPYYRVQYHDGTFIDHFSSWEQYLNQIRKISPKDVDGVSKFFKQAQPVFDKGFIELGDRCFRGLGSMFKVAPALMSLGAIRSVYSYVSKYVKDEKIRQLLSFHPLLIGGNPYVAPAIYVLISVLERTYGVWHAKGGMNHVMQMILKRFQELSGEAKFNEKVVSIDKVGSYFVVDTQSRSYRCKKVVINGDIPYFIRNVFQKSCMPPTLAKKIKSSKISMSAYLLYFGANKSWPNLPQHSIVLGPNYKQNIEEIFEKKCVSKQFSYYLHLPTRTDSTLAPDGKEVVYALIPTPNLLHSKVNWDETLKFYRERLIEDLEVRFMPGFSSSIEVEHSFTPMSFESNLMSYGGNAFGLEPRLFQSAAFRPENRSQEVEGLYFVGAGTQPGAGLPGVLLSARMTSSDLLKDLNKDPMTSVISLSKMQTIVEHMQH